jgi:hypothetical protein
MRRDEGIGRLLGDQAAIALVCATLALAIQFLTETALSSQLTDRAIARWAMPALAQLHYGRGAQARILVVDIDRVALEASNQPWPARYDYHARNLALLARLPPAQRPKVVFVDIIFAHPREEAQFARLPEQLCALYAAGIKVFLAAPPDAPGARLREGIEDLRDADGTPCFGKVSVVQSPDAADRVAWQYPLRHTPPDSAPLPAAALAIHDHLQADPRRRLGEAAEHDLALIWGTRAAAGGLGYRERGAQGEREYCRRSWRWADLLPAALRTLGGLHPEGADSRPLCVFHETLSVPAFRERAAAADWQAPEVVMYGVSADGNDIVVSPLHGPIPGVYLHAMALDNLLVYGRDYKRHYEPATALGRAGQLLLLLLAFFVVSLVFGLARRALRRLPRALRRGWRRRRAPAAAPCLERVLLRWQARWRALLHGGQRRGQRLLQRLRRHGGTRAAAAVVTTLTTKAAGALIALLGFIVLTATVGWGIAAFAHTVLNAALLTYAPIIVFCAISEMTEASALARHHLGLSDRRRITDT